MTTITGGSTEKVLRARHALALLPTLCLAAAGTALLLVLSGRYGYFGDELYFVSAGRHLDWGYADQPPLVPLIAVAMDTLFPGSLTALRAPAALAYGVGVVVAALVARELGADRRAQLYTATAYAIGFLALHRNLNTIAFDILMWTALTWLLIRWVRTHAEGVADDRLLLWAGVAVAISTQVKFQVVVFAVLLAVTLAIVGPREMLRRPKLWAGAAIATVAVIPTLVWQAANGWPQIEMGSAVSAEMSSGSLGGPLMTAALILLTFGPVFGMVLGIYGMWRLVRSQDLRPFRFLGWTALGVIVVFALVNGRPYYMAGVLPVLWAAGAIGFQRRREAAESRRAWSWVAVPAIAVSAILPLGAMPLQDVTTLSGPSQRMLDFRLDEIGWPKLASDVAEIHRGVPPQQQKDTVVITSSYWTAAALDFYDDRHDLPDVYSGSRGYWFFGQPPADAETVIHVGKIRPEVDRYFTDVRQVGEIDNGRDIQNLSQGSPIFLAKVAEGVDWNRAWPDFQRINAVG
ncbi:glycosyl transferase [Allosaccharopolyspora coralli]|uniref:Glycosyl transferase n=1 Tax=Allosaccharopolyspora coralli TaxID=2665642 RepID=A0A5Q3QEQ9_9PSEU|nr:glycosyltransferase family 39 protein [Allosaccharopolyspora coralli]QGK71724.1 glycosyl transferase [Allosaccharopolyspora coralli]